MEFTKTCCKNTNEHGRRIIQQYMDQFSTFFGMSIITGYVTGILFISKAFVTSEPFPMNVVYPFPVDYQPCSSIIFLHQTLYICNASGNASVSAFCGFLLFFAAARFEILKEKLHNVKSTNELIIYMEEYYVVKKYANFVVNIVKLVAPCAVIKAVVVLMLCGISFVCPQPLLVKLQYIAVIATITLTVFVCAWPADSLLEQSGDAMKDVFESTWYDQAKKIQREILIAMVPQAPAAIKVPCVISTLSLNFFCSFLSNAFSSFSVLRAVISEEENT